MTLFIRLLQEKLQAVLPSSADIETTEDNGVFRLSIRTPADLLSPAIPLNDYFDEYLHGMPAEKICRRILETYTAETLRPFCTGGEFPDRTAFLKELSLRPLSLNVHKKIARRCPHEIRSGFLFVYTVGLPGACSTLGRSLVTEELLRNLRIRGSGLFETALSNMKAALPAVVSPLSPYLEQLSGMSGSGNERFGAASEISCRSSFFVLTNKAGRCGSCSFFYPGTAEELFDRFGPYYVLPSSVHELLILPKQDAGSTQELRLLIREVNRSSCDSLLILSDELYAYDPSRGLYVC